MDNNFSIQNWRNQILNEEDFKQGFKEGVWSRGNISAIRNFIIEVEKLKKDYYNVVGSDDVFNGLDQAISAAEALLNREDMPGFEGTSDALNSLKIREANEEDEFDTPDDEKGPSAKDIASAEKGLEFEIPTSTSASNSMRSIIVKKVEKIEKLRDEKKDYTNDLLALKQYIKRDDVRKEVGASEIRNLVSSLIN